MSNVEDSAERVSQARWFRGFFDYRVVADGKLVPLPNQQLARLSQQLEAYAAPAPGPSAAAAPAALPVHAASWGVRVGDFFRMLRSGCLK